MTETTKRLSQEENNNLQIEPLTKTQLSAPLKELCKIEGADLQNSEP